MPKLLFVPVSSEALERLCRRAGLERRRPQDEAAILIERALGVERVSAEAERAADPNPQSGVPDGAA
jgi:hypothetical protein